MHRIFKAFLALSFCYGKRPCFTIFHVLSGSRALMGVHKVTLTTEEGGLHTLTMRDQWEACGGVPGHSLAWPSLRPR